MSQAPDRLGVVGEHDPLLNYREIADLIGLTRLTVRQYKSNGWLPEPDGYLEAGVVNQLPVPLWRKSTVIEWATREGRGRYGRGRKRGPDGTFR